jgi:hypothetical protein
LYLRLLAAQSRKHGLKVIEDSCQCDGGSYKGKRTGGIGHVGAFSFNDYKIMSSGEGGGFVTNDRVLYERAMVFSDSGGKKTELASFGVRQEDDYAYFKLRGQPKVLFKTADKRNISRAAECVLDLDCNSQPNQIVLALTEPRASLAATLAAVEEQVASAKPVADSGNLGPNDVLLVPDIVWRISHRFAELEGREFTNTALKGQRMDVAQQDIQFCLNRGGAELKSEAKMFYKPIPNAH